MKKLFTTLYFLGVLTFMANAQIVITELMYNNAGTDDYEFLEIYNNGLSAVDLTGYSFTQGVTYTFQNTMIAPDEYIIVSKDSASIQSVTGVLGYQWVSGSLNNSGEAVELSDANGNVVDLVEYDDAAPWATFPDGSGPSLTLCDPNADNNDPANWNSSTNNGGMLISSTFYADPGAIATCSGDPIINILDTRYSENEGIGTITIPVEIENANANATSFDLQITATSTATAADYTLPNSTITFPANSTDIQEIEVVIVDDMIMENDEILDFDLVNVTNNALLLDDKIEIDIVDNDAPLDESMKITGVFDAQPSSAGTKGVEIYVINDIMDAGNYGLGSANNGGGTDGVEFSFPAGTSYAAGDFIYIADDSTKFHDYFGFAPNFVAGAASINGDDAVELFENAQVIDVFGDINVDGNGEAWEYTDGWAYRNDGTGPDGSTFVLNNWQYSGLAALDGSPDNAGAPTPFPIETYSDMMPTNYIANDDAAMTDANVTVAIDVFANDVTPNAITSLTITTAAANGNLSFDGTNGIIAYTPSQDFCGTDSFEYEACDMNGCDQARVTVEVICPSTYTVSTIGSVTTNDGDGLPDFQGAAVELEGLVYGININPDGLAFVLIDENNDGITVYNEDMNFGYTVNEGDQIVVQGTIDHFSGLTEIIADNITVVNTVLSPVSPTLVTALDESTESQLVSLENVTFVDIAQWGGGNSGFNFDVTDGTNTYQIRIDNDVDLFMMSIPNGGAGVFNITGLGGQFDNSAPHDSGYQLLPRYTADIQQATGVQDLKLGTQIQLFPNPVSNNLIIKSLIDLDEVVINNLLGQRVLQIRNPSKSEVLNLAKLQNGLYTITFVNGTDTWTEQFVKQ